MGIVTVESAKAHLNIERDDDREDAILSAKIDAAEAFVGRWLPTPLSEMDSVPPDIREGVLLLVGHLYENREATLVGESANELPFGFWELLGPHRAWSFGA